MNSKNKIDIFSYRDYRTFLKEYYIFKKNQNYHFSYRSFGRKTGVAPSVLNDVITGRRNLTLTIMQRYASAMKLNNHETRYFETLVLFAKNKKATNPDHYGLDKKNLSLLVSS